jgi:hypothetical protein
MPAAAERAPAPEVLFWPEKKDNLPSAADMKSRGVKLEMLCGRSDKEVVFAAPGYNAESRQGFAWTDWPGDVYHARADEHEARLQLNVPKAAAGTVRVYIIDPDNFGGGRKEKLVVAGQTLGSFENFQAGRWIECPISAEQSANGKVDVSALNVNPEANAVISLVEWVEK